MESVLLAGLSLMLCRDQHSHRSRERSRERGSSRREAADAPSHRSSRDHRDRHHSSDVPSSRERPAPAPRRKRTPTPDRELRSMQRMSCTVMAYGLSGMAEEFDIFDFFSAAGELADVKLIKDKHSLRHKGIAYIEFKDRGDVLNALQLNGKILKGMPVNVKSAEAEKNFAWESQELQKRKNRQATDPMTAGMEAGGPSYLRVENVPTAHLKEEEIRPIFEAFGNVQSIRIEKDNRGEFTGVLHVQFPTAPEGRKAKLGLDGSTAFGGPPLRLIPVEAPSTYTALPYAGELDEGDESGGMRMTGSARTALMSRMSGAADIERPKEMVALPPPPARKPAEPVVVVDEAVEADKGVVGSASPRPTCCLLLKNMFNAEEEEGDDWPEEIAADTKEECSKYGTVLHVHVDRASRGFVYLKFADEAAAVAAQKVLHGRWYSNKQIIATYQFAQLYNKHFNLA
jgi:RNA-binding protein 23/39